MSKQNYINECKQKVRETSNLIVEYKRNKKGKPSGCVVAFKRGDVVRVGWSLCNKRDVFNRYIALAKAIENANQIVKYSTAEGEKGFVPGVPVSLNKIANKFMNERVPRYFK